MYKRPNPIYEIRSFGGFCMRVALGKPWETLHIETTTHFFLTRTAPKSALSDGWVGFDLLKSKTHG
jgi:hypothetical protein